MYLTQANIHRNSGEGEAVFLPFPLYGFAIIKLLFPDLVYHRYTRNRRRSKRTELFIFLAFLVKIMNYSVPCTRSNNLLPYYYRGGMGLR